MICRSTTFFKSRLLDECISLLATVEPTGHLSGKATLRPSGLDCESVIAEEAIMQQLVLCSVDRTEVK